MDSATAEETMPLSSQAEDQGAKEVDTSQARRPPQTMDTIDGDRCATLNFYVLVGITDVVGIILIVMVAIWMGHYRGGFAWDGTGKEFNYHPVFMVLSLVYLYGNAAIVYRVFRKQTKLVVKLIHMAIQTIALLFAVLGLIAVFDFHNKNKDKHGKPAPIPNMYSLHSWLGLTTVLLFCFQYLFGFLSFLWPKFSEERRAQYLLIHRFFGSGIFGLAIGSVLTGVTEKVLFSIKPTYPQFVPEGLLVNVFGILLVVFAGLVLHLVTHSSYKRPSDSDEVQYAPIQ